jgi:polysaccharide biosynthesis/export protein
MQSFALCKSPLFGTRWRRTICAVMSLFRKSFSTLILPVLLTATLFSWAQNGPTESPARTADSEKQSLRIAPGDELEITIFAASDLSAHGRVDNDGNIVLPLLGSVHVAGMTSAQAGRAIAAELQQKNVLNHPQVTVFVKEYTAGQISVVGEVNKPGVYSSLGAHRLLDILQTAGGLTDKAGNSITISHRGTADVTTIEFPRDPTAMAHNNVELQPGDTVIVPRAGIVYVLGEVYRPGGYASSSSGGFTVLQVMAAAGGPTHLASEGKTTMMRRSANGLQEIPVPLGKMLRGKQADIAVQPDDILYVPSSRIKSVVSLGEILALTSQAAVYRIP